jgi:hypothetical protein
MRYCEIPTLDVVLDDEHAAARAQIPAKLSNDGILVRLKVKRIRHHDSVEPGKCERQSEVGGLIPNAGVWKLCTHRLSIRAEGAGVTIDGVDFTGGAQQLRQGEGEGAGASPQVSPDSAGPVDATAKEIGVVGVVHRQSRTDVPVIRKYTVNRLRHLLATADLVGQTLATHSLMLVVVGQAFDSLGPPALWPTVAAAVIVGGGDGMYWTRQRTLGQRLTPALDPLGPTRLT